MDSLRFYATKIRHWEKGVVVHRYDLMRYDVLIPGRAYPWGEISPMEPTFFEVGEVVDLGFIEGQALPVILNRKPWPNVGGIPRTLSPWPTFRQSYGRSSRIEGTIVGSWAVEEALHPTVIRLADSRWERRGADGLWSAEEPWQLYRDGSAVGSTSLLMWHDLSVTGEGVIGLVAEEEGNAWFYDPDYPLPNETNSVTNGTWSTPLPNYEEDSGGGDDGGGDDDGGIIL